MFSAIKQSAPALRTLSLRQYGTSAPKVTDNMIALTAMIEGRRLPVLGRVGKNLADTLNDCNGVVKSGGGPTWMSQCYGNEAHVSITEDFAMVVPPLNEDDADWLYWDVALPGTIGPLSRLASKIQLTPEMNGMTFAVHPMQSQNFN
mmetsp:Transcript_18579/g.25755  ORF Transcript_18579/g.25755 Transcript_18579/m.25755 type:complete len:147 (-) Transcript_18579:141-581(-)|eukprot:CAMPEP_0196584740 /NCGR_PEP_ID=MMETSP1081-20130531/48304_1 /TAXON_ID=36882 /ORGANISM="Pyramimonas amylifera, Strain CCMP720" /LENGTH=146 /DNA_ID=CAMNT_0041906061 /DNA_START=104 /DNA_END=544 /DNA_ORIENTATION=-